MNTLKLEHLAPYLPYGLQMKCDAIFRPNHRELPRIEKADATLTPDLLADIYNKTFDPIDKFKPILRPLTDVTKEIEQNGKKFIFINKVEEQDPFGTFHLNYDGMEKGRLNERPAWVVQALIEYHFDVFGLIKKGLAININTLKL